MKILLLADYKGGHEITKFLKQEGEDIVGYVKHPERMENTLNIGYTGRIERILGLPKERIFNAEDVQSGKALPDIKELDPDIILSLYWGFILKPNLIDIPSQGCINLHLSYLPYNQGKNPNVWAIREGTPAGVTMHYIDKGIDTGNIISQVEVPVESVDTGKTLYLKLEDAAIDLFKETWPKIKDGTNERIKQDDSMATHRFARELPDLDEIVLDENYKAKDLINNLRARTFRPFPSAYFIDDNGRKVFIRVSLEYSKEDEKT